MQLRSPSSRHDSPPGHPLVRYVEDETVFTRQQRMRVYDESDESKKAFALKQKRTKVANDARALLRRLRGEPDEVVVPESTQASPPRPATPDAANCDGGYEVIGTSPSPDKGREGKPVQEEPAAEQQQAPPPPPAAATTEAPAADAEAAPAATDRAANAPREPSPPPPAAAATEEPTVAAAVPTASPPPPPPFPHSGEMQKFAIGKSAFGAKNWKRRHFVFDEAGLHYYESAKDVTRDRKKALGVVPFFNAGTVVVAAPLKADHEEVDEAAGSDLLVRYTEEEDTSRTLLLRCDSKEDRDSWAKVLVAKLDTKKKA